MRSKKYPFVPFLVPILLFAFVLGIFPYSAPAQNQKDRTAIDQLRQKAWSEGKVRVIVHFNVPDIEALTAASAKFGTADESRDMARERTSADLVLIKAVEYSAWKIVSELQGTDYEEIARFDYLPFVALRVSPNALAILEASADVLGLEEDRAEKLIEPVEDPGETAKDGSAVVESDGISQPMLATSAELVGAKAMWNIGLTGAGWYVAILDTGIRSTHQFFTGKNIVEGCRALGQDGSSGAGDCPNGLSEQNGPGSAVHFSSSYSGFDHGTHVAGIATGNYGSLAGIAKGANIIAVKVFSKFDASTCGGSSPCVLSWNSDQLAGLNYVYSIRGSYNIASVNMSVGGGKMSTFCDSDSRKAAVDLLRSAGIATAIATGNDKYCGYIGAPGCISTAVSVGSTTKADAESFFNNWDSETQRLFAPGSSITSATGASDSSYESWNGTSMATPHVAGAWALLKQALPSASVTTLLNALRTTGKAIYSSCDSFSAAIPRIRIFDALSYLSAFKLTIQTSAYGTTSPTPGMHPYPLNISVPVTAIPNTYATFTGWTGDASGTDNPVTVVINRDKTIKANFRYIYAPIAAGKKELNRSFSQAEYINVLSWEENSNNAGLSVASYNIYLVNNGTATLLATVSGDKAQYLHRKAGTEPLTYRIATVLTNGREGAPAEVTVQ